MSDESSRVLNGDAPPFEHAELNRRIASGFNDTWASKKKVTGTRGRPRNPRRSRANLKRKAKGERQKGLNPGDEVTEPPGRGTRS